MSLAEVGEKAGTSRKLARDRGVPLAEGLPFRAALSIVSQTTARDGLSHCYVWVAGSIPAATLRVSLGGGWQGDVPL